MYIILCMETIEKIWLIGEIFHQNLDNNGNNVLQRWLLSPV